MNEQQQLEFQELIDRPDFRRMFNIVLGGVWAAFAVGMLVYTGDYLPLPVAPVIAFGGVKWANRPLLRLDGD